jgi:hypothetical protein
MDHSNKETLDDRVDRYKAKLGTFIKSCFTRDRLVLIIILTLTPLAWAGFIYWVTKLPSSMNELTNKQQLAFSVGLMGIMLLTFGPVLIRASAVIDIIWHVICGLIILPALWIYQKFLQICSLLMWLAPPLAKVCIIRKSRRWDKQSPSILTICSSCRKIIDKSTILNGSKLGFTYPVERLEHLQLTALSLSAQQCRLCDLFLNAVQNSYPNKNSRDASEKQEAQLQVEVRVIRSSTNRSSVVLRLNCLGLLNPIVLPVNEIHYSMPDTKKSKQISNDHRSNLSSSSTQPKRHVG